MNGRGAAPGAALFLPAAVKKAERRRAARPRAPWPAIPPAGPYPSGPSCPDGRSCLGGLPRAGGLPYLNGLPYPRRQPRPGELCPAPARGNGAPAHAGEKADVGFSTFRRRGRLKGVTGNGFPQIPQSFQHSRGKRGQVFPNTTLLCRPNAYKTLGFCIFWF